MDRPIMTITKKSIKHWCEVEYDSSRYKRITFYDNTYEWSNISSMASNIISETRRFKLENEYQLLIMHGPTIH